MKVTAYVRVGQDRKARSARGRAPKVVASPRPTTGPLLNGDREPVPTVAFAIDLEVPDAMFRQAETVIASMTIPESAAVIAAEVKQ